MSKSKRELKKEEERRIIAEMEAGLQEVRDKGRGEEESRPYGEDLPNILHCKRCKTVLNEGVCPVCGFKIYVPIEKEKREKTKKILTAVFLVGFAVILLLLQIHKA